MNLHDDQKQEDAPDAAKLQAQCDQFLAGWKRAQADYQNLKRDTEREREEYVKYANERLLEKLLPVIDQFELALQHAPDPSGLSGEDRPRWETWMTGLRAVQAQWNKLASAFGLEPIATDGPFDPAQHEAAGEEEETGHPSGSIVAVVSGGWKLNGKVIRPARVMIAK